jgi:spore germination cell wall hydrolase CwlJ-like protein
MKALEDLPIKDTPAAKAFLSELEIDVLARTLWGEARSEGANGMRAVAHVILNRVLIAEANGGEYWWGHDVITVCQKPYQFSCWNPADPNRPKLMKVDEADTEFATALRIARRAVLGCLGDDITRGADHYHTVDILPFWAKGERPAVTIGRHHFYKLDG